MDLKFLETVYKTSVAAWLFVTVLCGALQLWKLDAGIAIGFWIALISLMLIERFVTILFTPQAAGEGRGSVKKLLGIALIKYIGIAIVLWASLRGHWMSPAGIAIGIGLPQAVILLKALGRSINAGSEIDGRL